MNDLKIFSGPANPPLTQDICRYLNLPMGKISLGRFPDGEISCKIDEDVRGRDVFIVQPTCPPVNEHIMELLVMIDSFKRASRTGITAVIPYFGYARQDRKDAGRVPITAKLVANLITRAGADRVLAMDLHAAQIQGFFDVPVDHLYAAPVLNNHFQSLDIPKEEIVVVSADEGGIKRAVGHANRLGAPLAIIDKRRLSRRHDQEHEHHRCERRGQDGAHVRRHDQHRRLDLLGGRGGPQARRQGDLRGRHARPARGAGDRAAQAGAPFSRDHHHRLDPAHPGQDARRTSPCSRWPACSARRSSGSTATSR